MRFNQAAALVGFSVICSCSSLSVRSPAADSRIVLATDASSCQTQTTHAQWYALFGAVPLNKAELPLSPGNTYRIREVHTPLDYAVTILGGTLLTITRKSMLVESCAEPITAYSAEDLEKKRTDEMRQVLDAVLKQGGDKGLPAFLMKDGSVKRGRIVEMSEESITILAAAEPARPQEKSETEKSEKKEKTGQIRVAKVLLTDGRTLTGEITSQTPRSITLRSRTGSITIEKAQIRRISYANEDVPAPAKEERVSLSRANIVRIVIAEETK